MRVRYLISGAVQGVGFRYFVLRRALSLRLSGWARNLPDGRVEVVCEGLTERIRELELALERGPNQARVAGVEKVEISDEVVLTSSFEIK